MQSECHVLVHEKCLIFQSKIFFEALFVKKKIALLKSILNEMGDIKYN